MPSLGFESEFLASGQLAPTATSLAMGPTPTAKKINCYSTESFKIVMTGSSSSLSLPSKSGSASKVLWLAIWAAAMYGTLQLHHFEASLGHSVCGPWGCGPPTMALVGYHSFWLLLIVPPTLVASGWLPADQAIRLGKLCAIAGFGTLTWVVIRDGISFWQSTHAGEYLLQRALFRLVTFVEYPLGPLGIAGLAMRRLGRQRIRIEDSELVKDTL